MADQEIPKVPTSYDPQPPPQETQPPKSPAAYESDAPPIEQIKTPKSYDTTV